MTEAHLIRGPQGRQTRKRGDSFYVPQGFRREGGEWGHMIGVDSVNV